jgi:hypothetical protein
MFMLLILFVVVVALFAVMSLANGPGFGRRGGVTIIRRARAPRETVIEREVPRERIVERVVERPTTVVEREYDA